jgi:hypothetical protein
VLVVLTVAVCCCVCFSHKYADAAVEDFALGLVARCCSVYGVQGTSMTDDDHTLTYAAHTTERNNRSRVLRSLACCNKQQPEQLSHCQISYCNILGCTYHVFLPNQPAILY